MPTSSTTGIAYDRRGSGEPLLLLHGTGGSRAVWEPVTARLAAERDLLLVDLPGHGASAPPPPGVPHTPPTYAEALARLLDELDIDRAHAAGNSAGGWTALELAKLGRTRSVVALGPAGLWARSSPASARVQLRSQHALGRRFPRLLERAMRSDAGRTVLLGGTVGRPGAVPADAAVEMARTFATTPTFDQHFPETSRTRFTGGRTIDVHVVVAWGERERLLPPKARLLDELPPHTRVVTLPGCGHVPTWDDPDLVARTILGV